MHHQVLQSSRRRVLLASGLTACASLVPRFAVASHHFEVAAVRSNPKLGLTDLYVFNAPGNASTVFILDANFLPKPGEDLLDRAAVYNIHCATDDSFKAGLTWNFVNQGDHIACLQMDEANGAVGAKGRELGRLTPGKEAKLPGGIRAWVGRAKDPFFGNSPGLGAFRAQLAQGKYDPEVWAKASGTNIFLGRTCCPLVLEVPNAMLGKKVSAFGTVAVKDGSGWKQVQYMGKPLMAHSMLFEDEDLKAAFDASRPDKQKEFHNFFSARIARSAHFAASRPDPFAYGDEMASRLLPDVIRYEVGTEAAFVAANPNGRKLSDDGMSTSLTWLIGKPTSQHLKDPVNYTGTFPFVIPA
ncbi:hypothetical protein ACFPRE_11175 [Variovorax soli]